MFTSNDVCRLAGITYRQLDYWCRLGILTPHGEGRGSGSFRTWDQHQASLAIIAGCASRFTQNTTVWREAVAMLADLPLDQWTGYLSITASGRVVLDDLIPPCIVLGDLAACVAPTTDNTDPWDRERGARLVPA